MVGGVIRVSPVHHCSRNCSFWPDILCVRPLEISSPLSSWISKEYTVLLFTFFYVLLKLLTPRQVDAIGLIFTLRNWIVMSSTNTSEITPQLKWLIKQQALSFLWYTIFSPYFFSSKFSFSKTNNIIVDTIVGPIYVGFHVLQQIVW